MSPELPEGPEVLDRFGFVSPDGRRRLADFVRLLATWQATHNLVSGTAMAQVWSRHIADSLQLVPFAGAFREWVDLGSGAGFPGLVTAIALADQQVGMVTLVESNHKKAAFLRAAAQAAGARVRVAIERIEQHSSRMAGMADVVSARALAATADLCGLAYPYLSDSGVLLLLKGQDFVHEEQTAAKSWSYDLLVSPSCTDPGGKIVQMRNLQPRARS